MKIVAERKRARAVSRMLWDGLVRFNRKTAGPFRYSRTVLAVKDEAERRVRRRGSRLIHLNTYSFQALGFYEKLGFRRFGGTSGSPPGASRHYYVKHVAK